jgi:uncharacterized protein (TIGR02118 family)
MYNLIVLAARPPDWTHDRFIGWWRGPHAEATLALPGLRAWRHTEIEGRLAERDGEWDGLSCLSFDSREALDAALASPEWAAAVAQVGDMRGRRIALTGTEADMFALAGRTP